MALKSCDHLPAKYKHSFVFQVASWQIQPALHFFETITRPRINASAGLFLDRIF